MAKKSTEATITGERIRRTKRYKEIKASLLDQLERSGNDAPYFLDLVDDYMKMYVTKELCAADIEARGVTVIGIGSTGQKTAKRNDSADQLLRTNQQMIKLLDMLGIKPVEAAEEDEEF